MRPAPIAGLAVSVFLLLFVPVRALQWAGLFFLLVILSSTLYSRSMQRSLTVERGSGSVRSFKFRPGVIEITVTNRSLLPVAHIALYDEAGNLPGRDQNRTILSLRGRERIRFRYELSAYNRGVYDLGPVTLSASDPLGLFPWRRTWPLPAEFVVYPSIHPLAITVDSGIPSGAVRVANPIYEDVTNYRSVREYLPGDDPRRIDWKVTARTGSLQTTQYLPAVSFSVLILLDLNRSHYALRNRYQHTERAIEAAASLIHAIADLGQSYGLVAVGGAKQLENGDSFSIPPGAGAGHAVAGLELLSRLTAADLPAESGAVETFTARGRRPEPGSRLIYIGPALPMQRLKLLAATSGPGSVELWYLDQGEPRSYAAGAGMRVRWISPAGESLLD